MVALIFASGLLFAAYIGVDAYRARAGRREGAELQRKTTAATRWLGLLLAVLFIASAVTVMSWLIPR